MSSGTTLKSFDLQFRRPNGNNATFSAFSITLNFILPTFIPTKEIDKIPHNYFE